MANMMEDAYHWLPPNRSEQLLRPWVFFWLELLGNPSFQLGRSLLTGRKFRYNFLLWNYWHDT
jgi:hypothetical protein